ncbi:hypothetical protein TRAPUB_2911 [Trametes pubescens]|uniref:Uncharacterized protein n=1 Tax=Trametes pubescens TaxID=154538 RepID=A0A1M2VF74_TRAPU|nr:hypothetical protein TRAPUB_2911 [Trametes pubescens]
MHALFKHYSPNLLACSGSGQRPLFSGISHIIQSEAVYSQTSHAVVPSSTLHQRRVAALHTKPTSTRPFAVSPSSFSGSMASSNDHEVDSGYSSSTSSEEAHSRIPLPSPFPEDCAANVLEFRSQGARGVSLADWIRLSEKRKTHACLDDPDESLDELIDDWKVLYQCQWPGYDAHTCYVAVPEEVAAGTASLRKVDLLDMVCQTLADWVLSVTRRRHTECSAPAWAIGLHEITFKHIYVVSVIEVEGYVRKWVPVLEIDAEALRC